MSSNLGISGLLATLLNIDSESHQSPPSARNLGDVSFSTALNQSRTREQGNTDAQPGNPTKKAIILQPVITTPTNSTPEEKSTWIETASAILTGFGAPPSIKEVFSATLLSNFPEYYVWVLPDSTENYAIIPEFNGKSTADNVEQFSKCTLNNASIFDDLLQGACVRIDYENRRLRTGVYIVNVINNNEDFANAVIHELGGVPCGEESPAGVSAQHAAGDAIGTSADNFNSEEVIYINNDAIYPYIKDMTSAQLIVYYHGIETGKNIKKRQNTILGVLKEKKDKLSGKIFLIPAGHDKSYSSIHDTLSKLKSEKGVDTDAAQPKLGFWSGGAVGGKTALDLETFAKVEIADPSPQNNTIPSGTIRSSNINMVYDESNWGTSLYPWYPAAIKNYISKMSGSGATIVEVANTHLDIMTGSIERLLK
jgi:hypothetical protein